MGTADNLFTIAVDQQKMLTANMEGDVMAAHTSCPPIVTMAQSLIRHDLYMAEIFGRSGRRSTRPSGPICAISACPASRRNRPRRSSGGPGSNSRPLQAARAASRLSMWPTIDNAFAISGISSNTGTPTAEALSR